MRKDSEIPHDQATYYQFFHFVVTSGIGCGLDHPIEWVMNAHRAPGGTLPAEYYADIEARTPRFLCETYDCVHMQSPTSADEVLKWCNDHYPEQHLARGYFDFLKEQIQAYINQQAKDETT